MMGSTTNAHWLGLLVVLFLLAVSPPAAAQSGDAPAAGSYSGTIDVPGLPVETRMTLSLAEDGSWRAVFDFPQEGITGLAARAVEIDESGRVYIELPLDDENEDSFAEFSGSYDAALQSLSGTYYQSGMSFPFSLALGDPDAAADLARERLASLADEIAGWLEPLRAPGLAIGVTVDGQTVMAEGFGVRQVEGELPVTPETRFHIASTTKTFTTALLAQLVDEELLSWDTPVIEYAPDFALWDDYATRHTTLRDLTAHRTGLARHDLVWLGHAELDREELFAALRYLEPAQDFRDRWQYSNLTFAAAGVIAERVTGQSWEELIRARLLDPLGMEATTFDVATMEAAENFAYGYRATGSIGGDLSNFEPVGHFAAPSVPASGSMQSSVTDMLKWIQFQLTGNAGAEQLLSGEQLGELHTPQMHVAQYTFASPESPITNYGLGWFIAPYRGHYAVSHSGIMDGCTAEIMLIPELSAGIVVLCNGQMNALPNVVSREIADRLLGLESAGTAERVISIITQLGALTDTEDAEAGEATQPPLALEAYAGSYLHPAYGELTIAADDDGLRGELHGFGCRLAHVQEHAFVLQDDPADELMYLPMAGAAPLNFELDDNGAVTALTCRLDPTVEPIRFERGS